MTINKVFRYTGAEQSFVVPSNIDGTTVTLDLIGGDGGACHYGGAIANGGNGGRVTGTLTVAPGDTIYLYVGQGGGIGSGNTGLAGAGGWPNGGAGGRGRSGGANAGGGGGSTAVRHNTDDLAHRVAVAGGGAGASYGHGTKNPGGDGGGTTGGTGQGPADPLATGGTQTAPGLGGSGYGPPGGANGSGSTGGAGCDVPSTGYMNTGSSGGGGGGGGWYGGGGGGGGDSDHSGGGGGGGSSYTDGLASVSVNVQGYNTSTSDGLATVSYAVIPNQPKLQSPANNASFDGTLAQQFSWKFDSDDASESQSAFDLRYSSDGGATWTTISRTTPNTYYTMPGGTLPVGDYQWQVRTYNSVGTVGDWSPSRFFTVAVTPPAPTITYPADGVTIGSGETLTWSTSSQDGYEVQTIPVPPLASGATYDSGEVDNPDGRSAPIVLVNHFPPSGSQVTIKLRTILSGIWSDWSQVTVTVSFVPPPAPTVQFGTAAPVDDDGPTSALEVAWTTPDPGSGEAAAEWVDIYLSTDGGLTSQLYATHQPVNGSWTFETPASGVDYWVQAVAHANASAEAASPWTL